MNDELRLRIDITGDQVSELVERLANDDTFREDLTADPVGVLAGYGIEVPPELLVEGPVELPSKEDVQQAIETGLRGEFMRIDAGLSGLFVIFRPLFAWPGLVRRVRRR